MDNLTHSLLGLALAHAGLRRKSPLATAALVIGANLPDVDGVTYLMGSGLDALACRRGWTHGIAAMALWPMVLTWVLLLWDRHVRERRDPTSRRAKPRALLLVAVIGIWSHPLLDLFNTYGVRLLMPFSERWFYGDTIFIIDPWLWLLLGGGVLWSRWRMRQRRLGRSVHTSPPARWALGAATLYVVVMHLLMRVGVRAVEAQGEGHAHRTMVAPAPATPFRREVIRAMGNEYEVGWLEGSVRPQYTRWERFPVGDTLPGAAAAAVTPEGRTFLRWSRFPVFTTEPAGDSIRVRIVDLRYADRRSAGWASVTVTVPMGADGDL